MSVHGKNILLIVLFMVQIVYHVTGNGVSWSLTFNTQHTSAELTVNTECADNIKYNSI